MNMEEIQTKICSKCGKEKLLKEFYKNKNCRLGVSYICKICNRSRCSERYWKNPDKARERAGRWGKANPEKRKEITRKWRKENPEKERKGQQRYYKANYEKILKINREWKRTQKNNPKFRLSNSISRAIRDSLRNGKEGKAWLTLVDYTLNDLKKHLEKLFTEGMNWNNYGEWHIDHKIPIAVFNFTKPEHEDFCRCWKLSNLQPLWKKDNLIKATKLTKPFQPALLL